MSTAYHPQTDGQTERVNQSLEQYLRCYVDFNLTNWSELLPTAEFAYNNMAHESTKNSPFFVEYGFNPKAGPELKNTSVVLDDVMKTRLEAQEAAKSALEVAAERMKWYYDQKRQEVPFKVGDQVLLSLKDYQRTERALQPRYEGPFKIVEQLSNVTFKLELPPKFRAIHPVFHASKLIPYTEAKYPGQGHPKPPPMLVRGNEEYEVEMILQHEKRYGKWYYLIRWKGYGREHDQWLPEKELHHSRQLLREYKKKNRILYIDLFDEEMELLRREN
jgi:hypothetical protein